MTLFKTLKRLLRDRTPMGMWIDRKRFRTKILSCSGQPPVAAEFDSGWQLRINEALEAPDNAFIPRHPDAGKTCGPAIFMHNGVKVYANSYYGSAMFRILLDNRGVHEPQEEKAFAEVLEKVPRNPVMLELGCYWAFYSLSLLARHPKAVCHLVEPDPFNLECGLLNFKLNKRKGIFTRAFVSDAPANATKVSPQTISVDSYCTKRRITHIHILHSDIQGFEAKMIDGAKRMLSSKNVDFVFISTHSNELHNECIRKLESNGYEILAQANLDDSFSFDGLIVAKSPLLDMPRRIEISRKSSGDGVLFA